VVRHDRGVTTRTVGTSITVALPVEFTVDPGAWVRRFVVFNPHADMSWLANPAGTDPAVSYKSAVPEGWAKPTPTERQRAHWFDEPALRKLVYAHVGATRGGGRDLPLGEFVRTFDGLSSTAKAKTVRAAVPHIGVLSDFERDSGAVDALLAALQAATKPPKATVLGEVPEAHYRNLLDGWFGVERFWFRRRGLVVDGLPWAIEVAVAETTTQGEVFFGVNYGAPYGDPLGGTGLRTTDITAIGAKTLLDMCDAVPDWSGKNRAAVVHVITPAPEFLDKGKIRIEVPSEVADAFAATITAAAKQLRAEKKARDRDARQARSRWEQIQRVADADTKITVKEAAFAVMADAFAHATGSGALPVNQRNLYYAVRRRVQAYGVELAQEYFRSILTEYQQEHGPLQGLYYDARGELHEPHTGRSVRLGTREVAEYQFPDYVFDKILYVEKEGFGPLFAAARLGERYDLAIVGGKGQPEVAVRSLFERAERGDYQLFVLHDADPAGYSIARTIAQATPRMPNYSVSVTDLGLSVGAATDLGLATETFTRTRALPRWMSGQLDDLEREQFEGQPCHWDQRGQPKQWACTRTELNAFTAPELVAYIEAGLAAHGATGKVIPPDPVIEARSHSRLRTRLSEVVDQVLDEMLDLDTITDLLAAENDFVGEVDPTEVVDRLAGNQPIPWTAAVETAVDERLATQHGIHDRARELLLQAMVGGEGA